MNHNEGHRSRQPTLPPFSSRTLQHPSFLPMYMAAGFAHHHTDCSIQTVLPIIPAEFFYIDPSMSCGRRVPNIVSDLRVFDCFQLNTPPPVMSVFPAPPSRPDPFRAGPPHPTRDLGSLTLKVNTPHLPAQQPGRVVIQLTQEEDQAITNLLKLHHQEQPSQSDEHVDLNPVSFLHPELMDTTSAEQVFRPQLQQRSCWSDTELEAANTLLSGFSLMDNMWGQNHNKSARTPPDPLLYRHHEDERDVGYVSFSSAGEYGEPGWGDLGFVDGKNDDDCGSSLSSDSKTDRRSSASGGFSEATKWTLSDSEGDAVRVLLSLGDTGALDVVQ